ncbi:MAG TPA: dockerin type I domain-containing protein [Candidatus Saccharimonadales bacterium]|nr:dockerin type I domain-containing protein [Candidatus Saccharimonadales bacterium]
MQRGNRKRNKIIRATTFSKANLAIFILIFAAIGGYTLLSSHATGVVANLWVDTDGGSCIRNATPSTYDTSTACGSLDAAFAASSTGDLVLVKCGTYPAQTINTVRTSGNVTFQSETSKCAIFNGNGSGAITFANKVGYLTLDNITIDGQVLASTTTGTGNNNITISNDDIDVGKKIDGPLINYSVGSNLTISHNTIGPSCCGYNGGSGWSPEGIRIGKPNTETASCQTQACDVTIDDNLIQYTIRDCQYWPSSGYGTCPDTTCTNADGCHMDGIHVWGMDGGTITANRLYGVECQGIYFEGTNNSLNRNINIVNNAISTVTGGCSNKGIYIAAQGSTDNATNGTGGTWNIAFNSGSSYIMGPNSCGGCQTGTTFNITGNNMELMVTNATGNNAGCGASAWGVATINFSYNVWRPGGSGSTNAACGATDTLASTAPQFVNEVSPPGTGIDLHLASGSTVANDFVPAAICRAITSTDIDGDTRPQGTACDAGADEYVFPVGAANIFMSTTGSDAGPNCVRFASLTAEPTASTVCSTMTKALSLAQPGDIIQLEAGAYGSLTISRQSGVDSPKVVVRGDPAMPDQFGCASDTCALGNVTISGLIVCGHGLQIQDLDSDARNQTYEYVGDNSCPVGSGNAITANHDIEMDNVHTTQGTLRGTNVVSSHERWGPQYDICSDPANRSDLLHIWPDANGNMPVNVTVDHSVIGWNYMNPDACGGAHADNVQLLGFNGLTFTNNLIFGEADDLWTDGSLNGTSETGTALIANNFFDSSDPGAVNGVGVQFGLGQDGGGSTCNASYIIENNTMAGGKNVTLSCSGTAVWYNNYLHASTSTSTTCGSGTFDYNVWDTSSGTTCGTHAKKCTPTWSNPNGNTANLNGGWDLHLAASDTCLKGAGNTTVYQATDIDGQTRPTGGVVTDAGADEYTTGSGSGSITPGDLNSDGHVNITDLSIMLSNWGTTNSTCDLNTNGSVDIFDLSILLSHFGA